MYEICKKLLMKEKYHSGIIFNASAFTFFSRQTEYFLFLHSICNSIYSIIK